MNMQLVDRTKKVPAKMQIESYVKSQILNGSFRPGDRLPTTEEIVEKAGVSSNTVRQAMAKLQMEGLVKSTPGQGTFVVGRQNDPSAVPEPNQKNHPQLNHIAAVISMGDGPWYPSDTMAGIMKEAEKINLVVTVYPQTVFEKEQFDFGVKLTELGIDGVIWSYAGEEKEILNLRMVREKGTPLVVIGRSMFTDAFSSVTSDMENAGFIAGQHFAAQDCQSVVLFDYDFSRQSHKRGAVENSLPVAFRQGLLRAFDFDHQRIDVQVLPGLDQDLSPAIREKLQETDTQAGIIFGSGDQFLRFLKDNHSQAIELLHAYKLVVFSNNSISGRLVPYIPKNFDFQVIVDEFEKIARFAVQKLATLSQGHLGDTKTLVKTQFGRFHDLEVVKGVYEKEAEEVVE